MDAPADGKSGDDDLQMAFSRLRPVIETGWEMPLLIRGLVQGIPESDILHNWSAIAQTLLKEEGVEAHALASVLDQGRDQWIQTDLEGWLGLHRFYPGVKERLESWIAAGLDLFIVTTKEGRFVRRLLQQEGIELGETSIFGKEIKQPKTETLCQLLHQLSARQKFPVIWFVEDRLKTLEAVQKHPDLASVGLYLADWGYNTVMEREKAQSSDRIRLLSLAQFSQEFVSWDL